MNAVNCVGVMGRGIALEFRKTFPENFKLYKAVCDAKQLAPGKMLIWERNTNGNPRSIVFVAESRVGQAQRRHQSAGKRPWWGGVHLTHPTRSLERQKPPRRYRSRARRARRRNQFPRHPFPRAPAPRLRPRRLGLASSPPDDRIRLPRTSRSPRNSFRAKRRMMQIPARVAPILNR